MKRENVTFLYLVGEGKWSSNGFSLRATNLSPKWRELEGGKISRLTQLFHPP